MLSSVAPMNNMLLVKELWKHKKKYKKKIMTLQEKVMASEPLSQPTGEYLICGYN